MEKYIQKWDAVKSKYIQQCFESASSGFAKHDPEFRLTVQKTFQEILWYFFLCGNHKDELDFFYSPMQEIHWGQYIRGISKKMGCEFLFGIDFDGFFLTLNLNHTQYIKSMNDDFWCLLAELPKLGAFHWLEHARPDSEIFKKADKLFRKSNSSILKLACSYILQELECEKVDMGSIELKWKLDIEWDELLNSGEKAFKIFYHLNYILFKHDQIAERRKTGK